MDIPPGEQEGDLSVTLPSMPIDIDTGLKFIHEALAAAGMEVQRSFDLQVARASLAGCTCPHHGTKRCTCQMVVLQVYGQDLAPAILVVHGRENITHLALVDGQDARPSRVLVARILEALNARSLNHSGREWSHAT